MPVDGGKIYDRKLTITNQAQELRYRRQRLLVEHYGRAAMYNPRYELRAPQ